MIIFFLQKYHAGGPDSPAYWEKSVTLGCRKFYFDNFKKRYHILVVNNGLSLSSLRFYGFSFSLFQMLSIYVGSNKQEAVYSNAKHTIEIAHSADVIQILFLFAVSEGIPFPDKGRKRD